MKLSVILLFAASVIGHPFQVPKDSFDIEEEMMDGGATAGQDGGATAGQACDTSHHAADPGNKCKYLMCVHKKWLQLPCGPGTVWKGNGCVADVKESENCPKGIVDGSPCSGKPCKNGGICSNVTGEASCQCTSGYTGSQCETSLTQPPNKPQPIVGNVKPGEACNTTSYAADPKNMCKYMLCVHKKWTQFACSPGTIWNGKETTCSLDSKAKNCPKGTEGGGPCDNSPCGIHGICYNINNKFQCRCSSGYTGKTCGTPPKSDPFEDDENQEEEVPNEDQFDNIEEDGEFDDTW